jgi:CRP-like cAMP-binding protein
LTSQRHNRTILRYPYTSFVLGRAGGWAKLASWRRCQTDLAAMAGVSREQVNRTLNDWKRRKLINQRDGYYWIENQAQLQKEAEL